MNLLQRPVVIAAAAIYIAIVVAVGLWAARRTRNARDFFIAGQRIGLFVTAMATMSAAFSGFVFLGGPGLTYRIGVASLFIVVPVGFTGGLLCWTLGRRLRRLAGEREIFTVPDALEARYASRGVAGLAAIAVALGSIAYLGLQIQALGVLLRVALGTETLAVAMIVGCGALLLYSVAGGMVAGVYTDVVQGLLMLGAATAVFVAATRAVGGWGAGLQAIAASPDFGPSFLEPLGRVPVFTAFGFFFVFGVGVLGQPHMLHKFFMIDDEAKLRWLPLLLGASQLVCILIWIGIGLAVPALVAGGRIAPLAHADDAAPLFLAGFAPDVVAGVALAGILAAVMSTADSFLNVGSAALVRDLPRAFGRPVGDQLLWGRVAVLGVAGAAALLAWLRGDLIAVLGTFAFGTFGAALAPALVVGFHWSRVTSVAAMASIATGLVVNVGLELLARPGGVAGLPALPLPAGVLPSAVSLAASFSVLYAVTWASTARGRPGATSEV